LIDGTAGHMKFQNPNSL